MNILIVESQNDQYFIEALAQKVSQENRVCRIDEFKHSSLDSRKLTIEIGAALTTRGVQKVGIILDIDASNETERLTLVNECIYKAIVNNGLEAENSQIPSITTIKQLTPFPLNNDITIQIACYFTNVDGQGELETILKAIKSKESPFADCLYQGWKTCFESKGKRLVQRGQQGDITDKELLKLWVEFYKRFDTLSKGKRNHKTTDWKGIWTGKTQRDELVEARGETIFDIDNSILDDLRSFLILFD